MKIRNSLLVGMIFYSNLIFNSELVNTYANSVLQEFYCGGSTGIPCKFDSQGIFNGITVHIKPYDPRFSVQQLPTQSFAAYTKALVADVNTISGEINKEFASCSTSLGAFSPFVSSYFVPVPEITTDIAVEQLNTIQSWVNATHVARLEKGTIDLLRKENPHFNNLVTHLIAQKTDWNNVKGSTVNEFFDWKKTYPHLSSTMRSYVRTRVFDELSKEYVLTDNSVLKTVYHIAHCNSQHDKEELRALYSSHRVKHNKELKFFIQDLRLKAIEKQFNDYSHTDSLDRQTAIDWLKAIESSIFATFKSDTLYREMALHYPYFELLINYLVNDEIDHIQNVKGSSIDQLCNTKQSHTELSSVINRIIKENVDRALHQCLCNGQWCEGEIFCNLDTKNPLDIPYSIIKDIHFTQLDLAHPIDIDANRLLTSFDGKYLYGTDCRGTKIVWDMETGQEVDISYRNSRMFERIRTGKVRDKNSLVDGKNNYAIVDNFSSDYRFIFTSVSDEKPYTLTLYKRPTKESRIALRALKNCGNNKEELTALLESDIISKVLTGFVQKNIKELIHEKLRGL